MHPLFCKANSLLEPRTEHLTGQGFRRDIRDVTNAVNPSSDFCFEISFVSRVAFSPPFNSVFTDERTSTPAFWVWNLLDCALRGIHMLQLFKSGFRLFSAFRELI